MDLEVFAEEQEVVALPALLAAIQKNGSEMGREIVSAYVRMRRVRALPEKNKQHLVAQLIVEEYNIVYVGRSDLLLGKQRDVDTIYHIMGQRELVRLARDYYETMWGAWTDKTIKSLVDTIRSSVRKEIDELDNRYMQVSQHYMWDSELGSLVRSDDGDEQPLVYRRLFDTQDESKNVVKVKPFNAEQEKRLMKRYNELLEQIENGEYKCEIDCINIWANGSDEVAMDIIRSVAYCFVKEKPVGAYTLIGPRRNGKSPLSNDATVLGRRNGQVQWLRHGDLVVGDEVMSWEGQFAPVIKTVPYKAQKIYKLTLQDGRTIEAASDHIWSVVAEDHLNGIGRYDSSRFVEMTTEDLLFSTKRWYLPPSRPTELPEQRFSIDPYILGVIIGDGNIYPTDKKQAGYLQICGEDYELVSLFDNCKIDTRKSHDDKIVYTARTSVYAERLIELGLAGKHSYEKFIPENYMLGSIFQRKELLAGLLDTDGTISKINNQIEFSTTSRKLAEQVRSLVYSLGGSATINKRMGSYTKNGQKVTTRENYRVFIRTLENPFRLERKAAVWTLPKRLGYSSIKSIEYVKTEDCQCIAIDTPSHLYLATENYIPTHNTFIGMLNSFVGARNTSPVKLSQLGDPHYVNMLSGTFLNAPDEEDEGVIKFQGDFKIMADHGVLYLAKMFSQEPLAVSCDFMCFFPMNHIPEWTGTGAAACATRTWAIPFYADLSQYDATTENFARKTFTTEFMLELAANVFALASYYTAHPLEQSSVMLRMREGIEEDVDSVIIYKRLFEKCFDGFQTWDLVYADYANWCKQHDYRISKLKDFKFHWVDYRSNGKKSVYVPNEVKVFYRIGAKTGKYLTSYSISESGLGPELYHKEKLGSWVGDFERAQDKINAQKRQRELIALNE